MQRLNNIEDPEVTDDPEDEEQLVCGSKEREKTLPYGRKEVRQVFQRYL